MNKEPEKLLACPFCGGESMLTEGDYFNIGCGNSNCLMYTVNKARACKNKMEAINAWNTRQPPPQVLDEKELLTVIKEVVDTDNWNDADLVYAIVQNFSASVPTVSKEEILGAVGRGWCTNKNKEKCMDADLAMDITEEVNNLLMSRGKV